MNNDKYVLRELWITKTIFRHGPSASARFEESSSKKEALRLRSF